ncbi:MAG: cation:proton antiporter regulatory subunit [bacterium]|nr:cation:proton antiporter regulatory subunit [bacterium]
MRQADLPGVGRKYCLKTHDGGQLVLILHHDGRREIYIVDQDEEPLASVTLHDDEARQAGAILGGAFFMPQALANLQVRLKGIRIEWFPVSPDSPVAGRTIGGLGVRQAAGVSVIAALREEECLPNPGPDYRIQAGDILVVAGTREGVAAFDALVSPAPGSPME